MLPGGCAHGTHCQPVPRVCMHVFSHALCKITSDARFFSVCAFSWDVHKGLPSPTVCNTSTTHDAVYRAGPKANSAEARYTKLVTVLCTSTASCPASMEPCYRTTCTRDGWKLAHAMTCMGDTSARPGAILWKACPCHDTMSRIPAARQHLQHAQLCTTHYKQFLYSATRVGGTRHASQVLPKVVKWHNIYTISRLFGYNVFMALTKADCWQDAARLDWSRSRSSQTDHTHLLLPADEY